MTNPIRPEAAVRASLRASGEAEVLAAAGGWGQNGGKVRQVELGIPDVVYGGVRSQSPHKSWEAP